MQNQIISKDLSIKDCLSKLDELRGYTLFIVNDSNVLIGTVTDGDIRRALISGLVLAEAAEKAMNADFSYLLKSDICYNSLNEFKKKKYRFLPVLNEDKTIDYILDLNNKRSYLPLDAVIMAGGQGTRLRPLTENTPKPLLKVGDKPIMEYNVDRLSLYGVKNLKISVNYLGEQLVDYFKDGSEKGMVIEYLKEDKPLGTLGSVVLTDNYVHDYILVMNSDLLTNVDFEDMFKVLKENDADMIIASIPYEVNVPYAVMETTGKKVNSFVEKPTYTYYSNAGIYIFKKEHLHYIDRENPYQATDLIQDLINDEKNVMTFPILGYWLDVGKHEDFKKAQQDVEFINF